MKKLTLKEIKDFFKNENCFETEKSFIINQFGKYMPNMIFLIRKEFEEQENWFGNLEAVDPLEYKCIPEITENMNVNFNGTTKVLFGEFWISKNKGTHCFRITPQSEAKHILIRVDWGGASNTRGNSDGKEYNPLYFRHAPSNGGGTGYDYWVFPKNYRHKMSDSEWD